MEDWAPHVTRFCQFEDCKLSFIVSAGSDHERLSSACACNVAPPCLAPSLSMAACCKSETSVRAISWRGQPHLDGQAQVCSARHSSDHPIYQPVRCVSLGWLIAATTVVQKMRGSLHFMLLATPSALPNLGANVQNWLALNVQGLPRASPWLDLDNSRDRALKAIWFASQAFL